MGYSKACTLEHNKYTAVTNMKKNILIALISVIIIVALIYSAKQPEQSYISFENDCIEADGPISEVVDRTVAEFTECAVISSGSFMESDYTFVRCGNTALNTSNFVTFKNRKACEAFSNLDTFQKKKITSAQ